MTRAFVAICFVLAPLQYSSHEAIAQSYSSCEEAYKAFLQIRPNSKAAADAALAKCKRTGTWIGPESGRVFVVGK